MFMALVCTKITEWIEEEVSKPIEKWEERQAKKCKKRKWYDPRGWFCWLVTIVVKVVRWVVVTIGKWVTRTVCKFVSTVVEIVRDVLSGLWDIVVGIVTLDWRRILDGFIKIGLGVVLGIIRLWRIVWLGDTIDFIIDEVNRWRLRNYVRGLLKEKYSGDTLDEIKESIRLDHGAFGLRLTATGYRTILDSETPAPADPSVPNLVALHESNAINLRELCGFEFNEGFWNRKRYKTLKKGIVVGGGGEPSNPISEDELEDYLDSRGQRGPKFFVLPMRDGVLRTKLRTAEDKGRELGLICTWQEEEVEVFMAVHIKHNGLDTLQANASLDSFLISIIGRTDKDLNDAGAMEELCNPVGVGVFRYTDTLRGLTCNLRSSTVCNLPGNDASGFTFIDNIPDQVWKYVPVHELGHYFGLCHVDGIDRIMFSPRQNTWWRGWLIPRLLLNAYLKGEPSFTFGEAKATWKYIVDNFTAQCLGAAPVIVD